MAADIHELHHNVWRQCFAFSACMSTFTYQSGMGSRQCTMYIEVLHMWMHAHCCLGVCIPHAVLMLFSCCLCVTCRESTVSWEWVAMPYVDCKWLISTPLPFVSVQPASTSYSKPLQPCLLLLILLCPTQSCSVEELRWTMPCYLWERQEGRARICWVLHWYVHIELWGVYSGTSDKGHSK